MAHPNPSITFKNEYTNNNVHFVYKDVEPIRTEEENLLYKDALDEKAIQNALRNLFLTAQGEVPGKPWLGNPLKVKLFDNIDVFLETAIRNAFINTVENFEPRVDIEDVIINIEPEYNFIGVELKYWVILDDKSLLRNYRFSLNYNDMTSLTVRKIS